MSVRFTEKIDWNPFWKYVTRRTEMIYFKSVLANSSGLNITTRAHLFSELTTEWRRTEAQGADIIYRLIIRSVMPLVQIIMLWYRQSTTHQIHQVVRNVEGCILLHYYDTVFYKLFVQLLYSSRLQEVAKWMGDDVAEEMWGKPKFSILKQNSETSL